jgi:hypothetical protein
MAAQPLDDVGGSLSWALLGLVAPGEERMGPWLLTVLTTPRVAHHRGAVPVDLEGETRWRIPMRTWFGKATRWRRNRAWPTAKASRSGEPSAPEQPRAFVPRTGPPRRRQPLFHPGQGVFELVAELGKRLEFADLDQVAGTRRAERRREIGEALRAVRGGHARVWVPQALDGTGEGPAHFRPAEPAHTRGGERATGRACDTDQPRRCRTGRRRQPPAGQRSEANSHYPGADELSPGREVLQDDGDKAGTSKVVGPAVPAQRIAVHHLARVATQRSRLGRDQPRIACLVQMAADHHRHPELGLVAWQANQTSAAQPPPRPDPADADAATRPGEARTLALRQPGNLFDGHTVEVLDEVEDRHPPGLVSADSAS